MTLWLAIAATAFALAGNYVLDLKRKARPVVPSVYTVKLEHFTRRPDYMVACTECGHLPDRFRGRLSARSARTAHATMHRTAVAFA